MTIFREMNETINQLIEHQIISVRTGRFIRHKLKCSISQYLSKSVPLNKFKSLQKKNFKLLKKNNLLKNENKMIRQRLQNEVQKHKEEFDKLNKLIKNKITDNTDDKDEEDEPEPKCLFLENVCKFADTVLDLICYTLIIYICITFSGDIINLIEKAYIETNMYDVYKHLNIHNKQLSTYLNLNLSELYN